jgi:hypothetical protein
MPVALVGKVYVCGSQSWAVAFILVSSTVFARSPDCKIIEIGGHSEHMATPSGTFPLRPWLRGLCAAIAEDGGSCEQTGSQAGDVDEDKLKPQRIDGFSSATTRPINLSVNKIDAGNYSNIPP